MALSYDHVEKLMLNLAKSMFKYYAKVENKNFCDYNNNKA